jgi:hypothetical protein
MTSTDGEDVLDALLYLGYSVEIEDDGKITATNGVETLKGRAGSGSIEWADRSAVFHLRERAYIARLRDRVQAAQQPTTHAAQAENGHARVAANGTKRRMTARRSPSGSPSEQ